MSEPILDLGCLDDRPDCAATGVIVPGPGVLITRQVGGTACVHPEVRGIFIPCPIPEALPDLMCNLVFTNGLGWDGPWAAGWRARIAAVLAKDDVDFAIDFAIDDAAPFAAEAWLPVTIGARPEAVLRPFAGRAAILTWPNSD